MYGFEYVGSFLFCAGTINVMTHGNLLIDVCATNFARPSKIHSYINVAFLVMNNALT
jgi:hypothetical protein